ncbi:MAG: hypothetical protein ACP5GU_07745 [Thermoprotei archaeon]
MNRVPFQMHKHSSSSISLLKLLSDDLNSKILLILWSNPSSPRRLSSILGVDESVISRRLNLLKKFGFVEEKWTRIRDVNVKLHYLKIKGFRIIFDAEGVKVHVDFPEHRVSYDHLIDYSIPKYEIFVGREHELKMLKSSRTNFIYVAGIAGIGKTALISKYVENLNKPTLWNVLTPVTTIFHVARRAAIFFSTLGDSELLEVLNAGVMDIQMIQTLLIKSLKNLEAIIVFDDYHRCVDQSLISLIAQLASVEDIKAKIIVISRNKPDFYVNPLSVLELGELSFNDVITLFKISGLDENIGVIAYKLFKGHPYILNNFISSYKQGIVKSIPEDAETFKYYLMIEILKKLSNTERKILEVMSVFREPVSIKALVYCGINYDEAYRALDELEHKMLINRIGKFYMIHEILRDVCYQSMSETSTIHKSIARYYLSLKNDLAYLEAIHHFIMAEEYDEAASILPKCIEVNLQVKTPKIDDYIRLLNLIKDKVKSHNKGWVLSAMVSAYILKGNFHECLELLDELYKIADSNNDTLLILRTHLDYSVVYRYLSIYDKALSHLNRAIKIVKTDYSYRKLSQKVYYTLATLYYFLGEFDKSEKIFKKVLKSSNPDDILFRATLEGWLGMVYRAKFMIKESIQSLENALKLFNVIKAIHSIAIAYREIANTFFIALKFNEMRENLLKSIEIAKQYRYPIIEAGSLIDLSIVDLIMHNINEGEEALNNASNIIFSSKLKIPEYEALTLTANAILNFRKGKYDDAIYFAHEAVKNINKCGYLRKFQVLNICGSILYSIDKAKNEGKKTLKEAIKLYKLGNNKEHIKTYQKEIINYVRYRRTI